MIDHIEFLDGTLVVDAINMVASLESTHETLSYDRFEKLNNHTNGLLGEYLICGQPVLVSAESAFTVKSGIIATTIAAIVAAIVYVVRKFIKLPSIQNIKTRLRNMFESMFRTKKAEQHIKIKIEPVAVANMDVHRENRELISKEYTNMLTAFIRINGNPEISNYQPHEFINFYSTKDSVYHFIGPDIFARTVPKIFLTEAAIAELNNLEYLVTGLHTSYLKKILTINGIVTSLTKSAADTNAIMDYVIPLDTTSITVYKMFLHRNNEELVDEIPLLNDIMDRVASNFEYSQTAIAENYSVAFTQLSTSQNISKLNTIVEKSRTLIESDKQYMDMFETMVPRLIGQLGEYSESAKRNQNYEIADKYNKIKDQLTMYTFTVNRTKALLKEILESVNTFIENNRRLDQDIFAFLKAYNDYTNKMVK